MRPNCECRQRDLPPDSARALICSLECTFRADCVHERLQGVRPNCGGGFSPRPAGPNHRLAQYPASTQRIVRDEDCPAPLQR
nr:DUF1272 domain-containing protein [Lysobacter pythonis]